MNFNDRNRGGHSERSEESVSPGAEILRCAQNDTIDFDCKSVISAPGAVSTICIS